MVQGGVSPCASLDASLDASHIISSTASLGTFHGVLLVVSLTAFCEIIFSVSYDTSLRVSLNVPMSASTTKHLQFEVKPQKQVFPYALPLKRPLLFPHMLRHLVELAFEEMAHAVLIKLGSNLGAQVFLALDEEQTSDIGNFISEEGEGVLLLLVNLDVG